VANDYRTRRRKSLERALEKLAQQYDAVLMQSVTVIDAGARVQAEQQVAEIDRRMETLQEELDQLALAPPNPARRDDPGPDPSQVHDLLRERLHRIDFRQVERVIRRLLDGDADTGRAGLLLFQQGSDMIRRLCAERIVNILKTESGALFRHFPIELRYGDRNDAGALLRHLAAYLDLDVGGRSRPEQLGLVSEGLCGSLQAGSIALLDIGGCDWLIHDEPAALRWIVTDFWRRLLLDLQTAARQLPGSVTVVALLFFDELPAGVLTPVHFCTVDDLRRERLVKMGLHPWTLVEVEDWLNRWGMPGHPLDETRHIAERIMWISGGMPSVIANELLQRCAALQPAL